MIDRYDLFGRRMEDTEPDMHARFVRFDQHNDRIRELEAALIAIHDRLDPRAGGSTRSRRGALLRQIAATALAPKVPTALNRGGEP